MSNFSIWLLEYGSVDRYPASNLFAGQPCEGFRRMPFCFGLARSADRCILIDTGFSDEQKRRLLLERYGAGHWRAPAEIVRRALVEPDDVDTIILTHNDFDHAGCVRDFPNAHVYIQREEVVRHALAAALPARFGFLTKHVQEDLQETLDERAERGLLTLLDGAAELADGVRVVPAFGTHTAGSQYVVVENSADGRWIFPGDLVYVWENIEGIGQDGVLAPIALSTGSPTEWLTAVARLVDSVAAQTRRVLPFHETRVWEQFPSRTYDDELHLAEISLAGGHSSVVGAALGRATPHGRGGERDEARPQVVLVHGAFHGAWCWSPVVTELARLGVSAAAVELPLTGFDADVATARSAIQLAAPGCVVCGHSYGGAVISEACAGLSNVARLVYVAAALLDPEEEISVHLEGSDILASLVVDESGVSVDPAAAGELFYSDVEVALAATMVAQLRPMASSGPPVRAGLEPAWRTIDATYVICTEDRALPLHAQRTMAARAETVVEWPTGHSPFVTRPADLAALLAGYLAR